MIIIRDIMLIQIVLNILKQMEKIIFYNYIELYDRYNYVLSYKDRNNMICDFYKKNIYFLENYSIFSYNL